MKSKSEGEEEDDPLVTKEKEFVLAPTNKENVANTSKAFDLVSSGSSAHFSSHQSDGALDK